MRIKVLSICMCVVCGLCVHVLMQYAPRREVFPVHAAALVEKRVAVEKHEQIYRHDMQGTPSLFFDFIHKDVDCQALWENATIDAERPTALPPSEIPPSMLDAFTYGGRVPVRPWSELLNNQYLGGDALENVWTEQKIDQWAQQCGDGTLPGNYGQAETQALREALHHIPMAGARVLVIGSENPWVEACVLNAGAAHIMTLEYGKIVSHHPKVSTITPHAMRALFAKYSEHFDAVVTFSSVEHAGLGRYGDAMNAYGDRQAIARAWCASKPGAHLVIAVPNGEDAIFYNAHRQYGPVMYPHLVANWQQIWRAPTGGQRVHVLQKPSTAARWVSVQLKGRLGNHLFIIASAHGIAQARGAQVCITNTEACLPGADFAYAVQACPTNVVYEPCMEEACLATKASNIRAGDYLQSFRYFQASGLPFQPLHDAWAEQWVSSRGVTAGIHVRRGDSISRAPPIAFFQYAIDRLRLQTDVTFLICTDDAAWIRQHAIFDGMLIVEGFSPAQDMALLAACQHVIISIGTFGWWGAFLRKSPGITLYYQQVPSGGTDYAAYFPAAWTPIAPDEWLRSKFDSWLREFKANDPQFQDFCVDAFRNNKAASQFSQDMWLFNNVFREFTVAGKKGFYVDSGANHYRDISNTFFFDVCLGWEGLCVEPSSGYHDGIRKHRTCKLVTECISASAGHMTLHGDSGTAFVTAGGSLKCLPLETMLAEAGARSHIDLWSLDVEGHELEVLSSVDYGKISVSVLLVEDFWVSQRLLDEAILNAPGSGLVKTHQFAIDSLFMHSNMSLPSKPWYPVNWQADMASNKVFRDTVRDKLKC